jgi:catechol 2,3-dioxygenase-like lactoylglutathione lyase family enzyme
MARSVNYDDIATTYDRRYQQNDYSGVEAALNGFVGEHVDQPTWTRSMESETVLPALTPELNVRDLTRSLDFYVRLLGFAVQFERADEGFAAITLGGASLMLEQIDAFDEVSDREFVEERRWITGKLEYPFGRGLNILIQVMDLDSVYNRLLKDNYPIKCPMEERWYRVNNQLIGVRQFMVMDPDGFLLRLDTRIGCKPVEATGGRH